ncbi:thiol:disulfide interchange protein [Caulobacter sp. Root655]|uniref:thioredoxin domain-containing protein n=1 Tax=Caulobacter sp. Root655 TaxID=1736578 RepID=UPI0006FE5BA0|nr:thioredoxin domain-containing protein [Caulobacter sp. Root655]KRA61571.1 thiol:disulfide interchange protein [Caulobacter sp. Root655]
MILDRRALIGTGLSASAWAAGGMMLAAAPTAARAAPLPAVPGDMTLGSPKAKVQVVEYASLSCTHCAHWNNDVFPQLKARFIDTGKVRYVFREFLTQPTEFAAAGYLLARRVGADRYFQVTDAVFKQQTAIFESEDLWGGLLKIGKSFGLTEEQFTAALSDKAALEALNARVAKAAERDQIESTPTFFVNGQRLVGGQPIEAFAAAIDKAAASKPAPAKPAKG